MPLPPSKSEWPGEKTVLPPYLPETPSLPTPSLEKGVVRWETGPGVWEISVSLPPAF